MRTDPWKTEFLLLMLVLTLSGCATGRYTPLGEAGNDVVEQLKENVYRVEYRTSAFTSQEQLDHYLRRRYAELTLREGYDFFHLGGRLDASLGSDLVSCIRMPCQQHQPRECTPHLMPG